MITTTIDVRQIDNTYNVAANGMEQLMTLLILVMGAYTVMNNTDPSTGSGQGFTIGLLVAFQMFASRLSQPMQREKMIMENDNGVKMIMAK
ncbi:MAG: hypothetical protein ACLQHK_04320 [Gallionellaceae bacterium]